MLPQGTHVTLADGSAAQNRVYCTKIETRLEGSEFYERGVCPGEKGERNDLARMRDDIRSGTSLPQIADDYFSNFIRYGRGIKEYMGLVTKQRDFQTRVLCLWGPTGCGKSRFTMEICSKFDYFWLDQGNGTGATWFDGYYGQPVVCIDEFTGWVPRNHFLRWVDRYPTRVQTKCGSQSFRAKLVVITSNLHPHQWWSRLGLGAPAQRRLSAPIGNVVFVASAEYPTQKSYMDFLNVPDYEQVDYFGVTKDFEDLSDYFEEEYLELIPEAP